VSPSSSPPGRPSTSPEQEFQALAAEWKATRRPTSSAARMAEHPAYQRIIGMGPAAVPFLLAELARAPDHWFLALHAITGEDPVPPECRGNVREMADAWVKWGKARGFNGE
jgi:hypothetical protein